MNVVLRPIEVWPRAETKYRERSNFSSTWAQTSDVLMRECRHLKARSLVMTIDIMERDIRLTDGWLKANAKPSSPRVGVLIDRRNDDALAFYCDRYVDWQDNVRAIALSLEALRKVDRYGVTSAGEQYTGWKALPAGGPQMSEADALAVLASASGMPVTKESTPGAVQTAHRQARRRSHPDVGGTHEVFVKVEEAARVLNIGVAS